MSQNTKGLPGKMGPENNMWKGGRSVASNGYVLIRVGRSHHLADVRGYAYEHRLVAEDKYGRRLRKGEEPHHVDGDKQNNHPDNLELLTRKFHRAQHRTKIRVYPLRMPDEANMQIVCACGCGAMFIKYDSTGRPRRFVSGHNPLARDPKTGRAVADVGKSKIPEPVR